ncbi:MAG TPA: cytochrome c [Casimicrobiaceae bacterium]|nr:cytochrome c [Casimicrobiaceae bacterium]
MSEPRKRPTLVLACAALAAALWAGAAAAADPTAGEAKVKEVCQACHGMDGNSQAPDYPKLGGQHRDYLAKALRDYKSGARKNPIMAGFAASLSAADIDNVSAYYAGQPAVLAVKH